MSSSNLKLCFIIASKVYKDQITLLPSYMLNILTFYPSATIIVVDNNSKYGPIFYKQFEDFKNIIILENTSPSKFEVGAYNYAAKYIFENNLYFDYYICTQDSLVLVNPYDFNILKNNNTKAGQIYLLKWQYIGGDGVYMCKYLNIYEENEEYFNCWVISFFCDHESLEKFHNMTKNIYVTQKFKDALFTREVIIDGKVDPTKINAVCGEFETSLGKILYVLNNNKVASIEGDADNKRYDCWSVNVLSLETKLLGHYFIKRIFNKSEKTIE